MDFLIDPNVAFVLLLSGFLIAILALLAPGTGFLEIAALMIIALAGYGIINLPLNWWAILIMVLGVVPFFLIFRRSLKKQTLFIVLSVLTFAIGSAFLFKGPGWLPGVNIILIVVMIPLASGITWLIAGKSLEATRIRPVFNLDHLIGMDGKANSDIRDQGSVYVNGEEWTAQSTQFIPAGSRVRIVARNGLILQVELLDK